MGDHEIAIKHADILPNIATSPQCLCARAAHKKVQETYKAAHKKVVSNFSKERMGQSIS
jgi:hypothetical protein